jgi:hypothetical protein
MSQFDLHELYKQAAKKAADKKTISYDEYLAVVAKLDDIQVPATRYMSYTKIDWRKHPIKRLKQRRAIRKLAVKK